MPIRRRPRPVLVLRHRFRPYRHFLRSEFLYGAVIDAAITFVGTAAAIYFFVVVPFKAYQQRRGIPATTRSCPECTSSISVAAKRCPHCTTSIAMP